jgi:hypothetical protein
MTLEVIDGPNLLVILPGWNLESWVHKFQPKSGWTLKVLGLSRLIGEDKIYGVDTWKWSHNQKEITTSMLVGSVKAGAIHEEHNMP